MDLYFLKVKKIKEIILKDSEVVVYPEVLEQFDINVGEKFSIGSGEFTVVDVVEEDSDKSFEMGAVAPKVFYRLME